MLWFARSVVVLLLPAVAACQLPSSGCNRAGEDLQQCSYLTPNPRASFDTQSSSLDPRGSSLPLREDAQIGSEAFLQQAEPKRQHFHWGRALLESFMFLSIEQAYVVHDDYKWVVVENGVPFNHYWRDYKYSLHTWLESGWNDGDPLMYGYLGHPIQGSFTSFIQIQNDPRGDGLEFSNT